MFPLLVKMVKPDLVEKINQANATGVLTDEVLNIINIAQLIHLSIFVDVNTSKATTEFIGTDDLLKDSNSPNATTIKNTIVKHLNESGLDDRSSLVEGCSTMTGKRNGVPSQLPFHCVSMFTAFASCNSTVDKISFSCGPFSIILQRGLLLMVTQVWS